MIGLFRPSGGLFYHLKARRNHLLWQSFNIALAQWLERWTIERRELVLIGPSGGYTLPPKWLATFASVIAYDVDPLAGWIFKKRHPDLQIDFRRRDAFWHGGKLSFVPLKKILKEHPNANILFCNILGQLPLEGSFNEHQWEIYLNELRVLLNEHRWASYHDLATIEPVPLHRHLKVLNEYAISDGKSVTRALGGQRQRNVTVTDHLMRGRWTAELNERRLFAWSLTPNSLHVIEGVMN